VNRCAFPVLDSESRVRICGKPATTTRMVSGFGAPAVEMDACDACAANVDTKSAEPKAGRETSPIAALVDRTHGRRAPGAVRMRRIVLRMPAGDVARVDALLPRFKVPRADLLRAFVLFGLAAVEEPAAPKDGAP